jgi:hypothetical protein
MRLLIQRFNFSPRIGRTGLTPMSLKSKDDRAIQLLLGAELAELYEVFLQQPVRPGISRLLDKLAQRELEELR